MPAILLFLGAVALLILVHELGHFFAAKSVGIKVEELGLGFPPRLAKLFKVGETDITLNWIPLGGFVRTAGENDPTVEGGLSAANPWKRLVVLISGPIANFLAALILFSIIFAQLGRPDFETVLIQEVSDNSPAQMAGLQIDDIVLDIAGEEINSSQELQEIIYANLGIELVMHLEREGQSFEAVLTPRNPPPDDGAIGIIMGNPSVPIQPWEALYFSAGAIGNQINALFSLPGQLISGEVSGEQGRLVGYKGMYDIFTEVRAADAGGPASIPSGVNTMAFFASISVSLGLLNLLPIPALDGGRILFTLPEIIFGKRIPAAYENTINVLGFALLILLMIYVNVQDFVNPIVLP